MTDMLCSMIRLITYSQLLQKMADAEALYVKKIATVTADEAGNADVSGRCHALLYCTITASDIYCHIFLYPVL